MIQAPSLRDNIFRRTNAAASSQFRDAFPSLLDGGLIAPGATRKQRLLSTPKS
jgi:hypothetical protein